jgi:tetratricopeptide (TPR) repeat protein
MRAASKSEAPNAPPAPLPGEAFRERDNLSAAMHFGIEARRYDLVLRTAIALDAASMGSGLSRGELAKLDLALRTAATHDVVLIERALGVRAAALLATGSLVEAKSDASRALSLATRRSDRRQMGAMHAAVAQACFQLGELGHALDHLGQALALERETSHQPAVASVLQQLGAVHQSLGQSEQARVHHESALALAVEIVDAPAEARASIGLGSYYLEQGDLARAESYYERGRALAASLRMQRSERIVVGYLGVLKLDAGAFSEAEELLRDAMTASREAGDLRVAGVFEGVRGAALAACDRVLEARSSFELADRLLAHNRFFAAVIALYHGHLDLAEARAAFERGAVATAGAYVAEARRRIEDARQAHDVGEGGAPAQPLVKRSDDARIAVRILKRAIFATERIVSS